MVGALDPLLFAPAPVMTVSLVPLPGADPEPEAAVALDRDDNVGVDSLSTIPGRRMLLLFSLLLALLSLRTTVVGCAPPKRELGVRFVALEEDEVCGRRLRILLIGAAPAPLEESPLTRRRGMPVGPSRDRGR